MAEPVKPPAPTPAPTPATDQFVTTTPGGPAMVPVGTQPKAEISSEATMLANAPIIASSIQTATTEGQRLESGLNANANKVAKAATDEKNPNSVISTEKERLAEKVRADSELVGGLSSYIKTLQESEKTDTSEARQAVKDQNDAYLRQVSVMKQTRVNNWWADASTPVKILGLISQALAGAANAIAGNPSAETPLDKVINADLKQQMANIDLQKDKVGIAKGVFQEAQDNLKNVQLSWEASRQVAYTDVFKKLDLMEKTITDPEQKAILAKMKQDALVAQASGQDKALIAGANAKMQGAATAGQTALALNKQALDTKVAEANIDHLNADTRKKLNDLLGDRMSPFADVPNAAGLKDRITPAAMTEITKNLQDFNELDGLNYLYQTGKTDADKRQLAAQILITARRLAGTGAAMSPQEYSNIVLAFGASESWFATQDVSLLRLPQSEAIQKARNNSEAVLRSKLRAMRGSDGQPLEFVPRPIDPAIRKMRENAPPAEPSAAPPSSATEMIERGNQLP